MYVNADPKETISELKQRLAFALNETKALQRERSVSGTGTNGEDGENADDGTIQMDDDIDIPMPTFATSSTPSASKDKGKGIPKKSDSTTNENSSTSSSSNNAASSSYTPIEPENIKIGMPIRENDFSAGFKEIKSMANGKQQKLESAGIKTNMSLAFATQLDAEFDVALMKDDYYADEE